MVITTDQQPFDIENICMDTSLGEEYNRGWGGGCGGGVHIEN